MVYIYIVSILSRMLDRSLCIISHTTNIKHFVFTTESTTQTHVTAPPFQNILNIQLNAVEAKILHRMRHGMLHHRCICIVYRMYNLCIVI